MSRTAAELSYVCEHIDATVNPSSCPSLLIISYTVLIEKNRTLQSGFKVNANVPAALDTSLEIEMASARTSVESKNSVA